MLLSMHFQWPVLRTPDYTLLESVSAHTMHICGSLLEPTHQKSKPSPPAIRPAFQPEVLLLLT